MTDEDLLDLESEERACGIEVVRAQCALTDASSKLQKIRVHIREIHLFKRFLEGDLKVFISYRHASTIRIYVEPSSGNSVYFVIIHHSVPRQPQQEVWYAEESRIVGPSNISSLVIALAKEKLGATFPQ